MSVTTIEPRPMNGRLGQATAVEQTRAVAEVQAAIVVAQQCPRNVPFAIDSMRESCRRKELAERAFFSYKRGSSTVSGPSVHLARELARCWGNIQYGLREMRRDDDASEMLAFAWDVQTNARCDNVVINPHRAYAGGRELTELRDVYENNASVGARRVRETIFAVLPTWFVEEAISICNDTLVKGDGKPVAQRIADAIAVFAQMGVTVAQLEDKLGPSAKWTERDVAQLRVTHRSITRGEITRDDAFPQALVTAADIVGSPQTSAAQSPQSPPPGDDGNSPAAPPATSSRNQSKMGALLQLDETFALLGITDDDDRRVIREWIGGHDWEARAAQIRTITGTLQNYLQEAEGDPESARSALWQRYHEMHPQDRLAAQGGGDE